MISKIGPVSFEHHPEFRGDVAITKGDTTITVSMESLRKIVAESVRFDLGEHVRKMKPSDLLRRIA